MLKKKAETMRTSPRARCEEEENPKKKNAMLCLLLSGGQCGSNSRLELATFLFVSSHGHRTTEQTAPHASAVTLLASTVLNLLVISELVEVQSAGRVLEGAVRGGDVLLHGQFDG